MKAMRIAICDDETNILDEVSCHIEKYSEVFLKFGLRYELSDFVSAINGNNKDDFKLTKKESVAIAGIIEEFLKQNR